jgi:hypothetical protein
MEDKLNKLLRRQKILADFGDFALQSEDLDEVLTEACRLVGEALGTGRAKVLEIDPGGGSLLVRAGVGWDPGIVGHMRLLMNERSSETYSIKERRPVITRDINEEERFEVPGFMKKAGVVALANVPILLPGGNAYGLLQVDDTQPRDFGQDDTEFLRTYATIWVPSSTGSSSCGTCARPRSASESPSRKRPTMPSSSRTRATASPTGCRERRPSTVGAQTKL